MHLLEKNRIHGIVTMLTSSSAQNGIFYAMLLCIISSKECTVHNCEALMYIHTLNQL